MNIKVGDIVAYQDFELEMTFCAKVVEIHETHIVIAGLYFEKRREIVRAQVHKVWGEK